MQQRRHNTLWKQKENFEIVISEESQQSRSALTFTIIISGRKTQQTLSEENCAVDTFSRRINKNNNDNIRKKVNSVYFELCLIRTRVIRTFANSNKLVRSLENIVTKDLYNSNLYKLKFS